MKESRRKIRWYYVYDGTGCVERYTKRNRYRTTYRVWRKTLAGLGRKFREELEND